ncbi:MAG TPA: NAD(P)-dependent oxidoreductase [Solirubrobacteraceae bacterium]|jgi:3-hydroxyisobutyrate dehydrogenase-like beta-hydroxyacid dehydrogenase|nr:NAD(P)-dependent oxidoreductase [Solirubrobacteraceae bacterium]
MRIAFLGLGIMGSRMAANLAAGDFELTVWNRTAARAEELATSHAGVEVAASPQAAATDVDVVVSMVVDGPQVEAILLGEDGAAAGASPGTTFVDCSTIGPEEARRIGAALQERSLTLLDAPVTGSSPRAEDGTLTIMVGGPDEAFARVRPVLEAMGELIVHAGPLGQGQLVKVINNAVAASNAAVLGEALLMAQAAGADLDALIEVMAAGSGGSAMLTLKAEPMRRHDYTTLMKPGPDGREEVRAFFKTDHMLKDVRLCLEAAREAGIEFPAGEATERILATASELGHGEHDFAALITALERQTGSQL